MHILIPALHRPTQPTGVCRHAANLAQSIASISKVCHVTLLIGSWQNQYFRRSFNLDSPKISLVTVDIENTSLSRNWWFMFGLPKLTQQLNPDIMHMSFPFPFMRRWFKIPVITTIHDLYPYEYPENFGYPQVWFNQAFLWQCIHSSDGLVSVSQQTLNALKRHFPNVKDNRRNVVVYNVVDFSSIKSQAPRQPILDQLVDDSTNPFLITVAQHRKNKNLDLLIKAYAALRCQDDRIHPNTRLVLVGSSGPETESLMELVRSLDIEQQVLFLSGLSDEELRWLYEQASLFVIASSTEGFCLPLVEALTLSCPTVCSDIPILREVGSDRCRYFDLNQAAQQNLMEAIAAELAAGKNHEQPTENPFSRAHIARQLLDFYRLFV